MLMNLYMLMIYSPMEQVEYCYNNSSVKQKEIIKNG